MADRFESWNIGLESPAALSETADFSSSDHEFDDVPRAVYVNAGTSGGDLVCRLKGDESDATFQIDVSTFIPIRITHVRDSSTVSGVIGLF